MNTQKTQVHIKDLVVGMFVLRIDGDKAGAVPDSGLMMETKEQVESLKLMCHLAYIDIHKSSAEATKHWANFAEKDNCEEVKLMPINEKKAVIQAPLIAVTQNKQQDLHGYKGRLIYRVLAQEISKSLQHKHIDVETFQGQLDDLYSYLNVNSDVLFLESQLYSLHSETCHIALRSAIHVGIHCLANNRSTSYASNLMLAAIIYVYCLDSIDTQSDAINIQFSRSTVDDLVLDKAIQETLKTIVNFKHLPFSAVKIIQHMHETFTGHGPQQIAGDKLQSAPQIVNVAVHFELMQMAGWGYQKQTAVAALTQLRSMAHIKVSERTIEDMVVILPNFPTGQLIRLGKAQTAIVTGQHPQRKLNPELLALTDAQGQDLTKAQKISSEVKLGHIQHNSDLNIHHFADMIRDAVEPKKPWYKRLFNKIFATGLVGSEAAQTA